MWAWGDYLAPLLLDADHARLSVAITRSYRELKGSIEVKGLLPEGPRPAAICGHRGKFS